MFELTLVVRRCPYAGFDTRPNPPKRYEAKVMVVVSGYTHTNLFTAPSVREVRVKAMEWVDTVVKDAADSAEKGGA